MSTEDRLTGRERMTAYLMLVVLAVLAASGLVFYGYLESTIVGSYGAQSESLASIAAGLVEARLEEYRELRTAEDESRPVYRELKALLQRMRGSGAVRFVYTQRRVSDRQFEYVLDAEEEASPDVSHIGDLDEMDELNARAFDEGRSLHTGLVRDPRWGVFITGYAPIVDPATGRLEGFAAVDVAARTIDETLARARFLIAAIVAVLAGGALVPIFGLSRRIARQIKIDPLTETFAKRSLLPDLERAARRARAEGQPLSVVAIDLDHFKLVNDEHGHEAGDLVLRAAARSMKAALRAGDRLYRSGGEEFALVLPGTGEAGAAQAAERARRSVEAARVALGDGAEVGVTVSAGVATLAPGEDPSGLFKRADVALYESKRGGRNRVTTA